MAKQPTRIVSKPEDALKIMGGPVKVGRWWGISHSTVCGMAQEGRISSHYTLHTLFYLKHLGYRVSPRLFGLKRWSQLYPPSGSLDGSRRRAG